MRLAAVFPRIAVGELERAAFEKLPEPLAGEEIIDGELKDEGRGWFPRVS